MNKQYLLFVLGVLLVFSACIDDEKAVVESPGEFSIWVDVDKYFGVQTEQLMKVSFVNDDWEFGVLQDGNVKINDVSLSWNEYNRFYVMQNQFTLHSDTSYQVAVTLNDDEIYTSEIVTPIAFDYANIPDVLHLNSNTAITWEPAVEFDSIEVVVHVRSTPHENWSTRLQRTILDEGTYVIDKNNFPVTMKGWDAYVELIRYRVGSFDPAFKRGSAVNARYTFLKDEITIEE